MTHQVICWTYLVIGLSAGIIIFIMIVTGVVLPFAKQVTGAAEGKFRASASPVPDFQASTVFVTTRLHAFGSPALPTQMDVKPHDQTKPG